MNRSERREALLDLRAEFPVVVSVVLALNVEHPGSEVNGILINAYLVARSKMICYCLRIRPAPPPTSKRLISLDERSVMNWSTRGSILVTFHGESSSYSDGLWSIYLSLRYRSPACSLLKESFVYCDGSAAPTEAPRRGSGIDHRSTSDRGLQWDVTDIDRNLHFSPGTHRCAGEISITIQFNVNSELFNTTTDFYHGLFIAENAECVIRCCPTPLVKA